MAPKAVLVDLGGVLVGDLWPEAARDWGARLGVEPAAVLSALFSGHEEAVLVGRVAEEDWWRLVGRRLELGETTLAELIEDLARRETWDEGLARHLAAARRRARVVLVSNAWPDTRRRVERHGGDQVLDAVVLSCEVGVAKPDEGIYAVALDRAGVRAAEAIFVDDIEVNVAAARRLGLSGHLHTGREGTIAAIEEFLARP